MERKKTFGRVREKIKIKYGNLLDFSEEIGINKATLSKKMNGKSEWTRSEIEKICALLEIPTCEIGEYFFYN
jgi:DNA-binding Xre family transcriptional regulator